MTTFAYKSHQEMAGIKLKIVLKEEAFNFIESLPQSAGDKIFDNLHRIEEGELNVKLFKKLEGTEIWEFRTLHNRIAYRLFAFWDTDEGALVIATHGIIKKTQKTPAKEIAKAEKIRQEHFKSKGK